VSLPRRTTLDVVVRKAELEASNATLRALVEEAAGRLGTLAASLDWIVERRGGDEAVELLARRARTLAELLSDELRGNPDEETIGLLVRLGRHWITRAVAEGVVTALAAKYGPDLIGHADAAIQAAEDVLGALGGVGDGMTLPGTARARSTDTPFDDAGTAFDGGPASSGGRSYGADGRSYARTYGGSDRVELDDEERERIAEEYVAEHGIEAFVEPDNDYRDERDRMR
jgi:hypothetical protein